MNRVRSSRGADIYGIGPLRCVYSPVTTFRGDWRPPWGFRSGGRSPQDLKTPHPAGACPPPLVCTPKALHDGVSKATPSCACGQDLHVAGGRRSRRIRTEAERSGAFGRTERLSPSEGSRSDLLLQVRRLSTTEYNSGEPSTRWDRSHGTYCSVANHPGQVVWGDESR